MRKVFFTVTVFIFLALGVYKSAFAESLTIPIGSFIPAQENAQYSFGHSYGYLKNDSPYNWFLAPIYLPDGAKITKVTLFFVDPDTSSIQLWVIRTNLYNGLYTENFYLYTLGAEIGLRNQSDSGFMKVNYSGYEHVIMLYLPASSAYKVYGVKLIYHM